MLFVLLFNRVADRATLISNRVLYKKEVFNRGEVKELQSRLGRLNTLDLMNICQTSPSNLSNRFAMKLDEHEGHTMCKVLIRLAAREDGENFKKSWYSEAAGLLEGEQSANPTGTADASK